MKKLTLLGIWNILPLGNWTWFNDVAVRQLQKLTGRKLGIFCYIKNDLHYECFTQNSTDLLKKDLLKLSYPKQIKFINKLSKDYFKRAQKLEKIITRLESQIFNDYSNKKLADCIEKLAKSWSEVTMQIWYAVLLDIWFPSQTEMVDIKKIMAIARDHCGHLHERSDAVEQKIYSIVAQRLNLNIREIYFAVQPEILLTLRKNKIISKKVLTDRMKLFVESNHTGKYKIYEGQNAKKIMKLYEPVALKNKKLGSLTGTPACVGKTIGRVRVITLNNEFSDFQQGEILVTIQTMVHYLPIMKMAKAILTEFGGLTSHAAIISRELKTPCIVGIAGLINSLKTGDLVEVDAENGIVKRI